MADAHGSGPCESNLMRVQVPSPAQEKRTLNVRFFVQEKNVCTFLRAMHKNSPDNTM